MEDFNNFYGWLSPEGDIFPSFFHDDIAKFLAKQYYKKELEYDSKSDDWDITQELFDKEIRTFQDFIHIKGWIKKSVFQPDNEGWVIPRVIFGKDYNGLTIPEPTKQQIDMMFKINGYVYKKEN